MSILLAYIAVCVTIIAVDSVVYHIKTRYQPKKKWRDNWYRTECKEADDDTNVSFYDKISK